MAQTQKPKLTEWSREKPTMIGEYNASVLRNERVFRWWNGENWSIPYYQDDSAGVKRMSRRQNSAHHRGSILWRGLVEQPHYSFPPEPLEKTR